MCYNGFQCPVGCTVRRRNGSYHRAPRKTLPWSLIDLRRIPAGPLRVSLVFRGAPKRRIKAVCRCNRHDLGGYGSKCGGVSVALAGWIGVYHRHAVGSRRVSVVPLWKPWSNICLMYTRRSALSLQSLYSRSTSGLYPSARGCGDDRCGMAEGAPDTLR